MRLMGPVPLGPGRRAGVWSLLVFLLAFAQPASALELELPGERRVCTRRIGTLNRADSTGISASFQVPPCGQIA